MASIESTPIDRRTRVRRGHRIVFRDLSSDKGSVLLHLDTGQYHGINDIGALIWRLVGNGATVGELIDGVRAETSGRPPSLEAEVQEFVEALIRRSLLEVTPA